MKNLAAAHDSELYDWLEKGQRLYEGYDGPTLAEALEIEGRRAAMRAEDEYLRAAALLDPEKKFCPSKTAGLIERGLLRFEQYGWKAARYLDVPDSLDWPLDRIFWAVLKNASRIQKFKRERRRIAELLTERYYLSQ
jgi:hypothetical protein